MAMIKCPECGKDVSSKAPACPNCGNPVNTKSGPFGSHEKGMTTRPGFWHDPNVGAIGCLVIFVIVIFVIVVAITFSPSPYPEF
jgi:uncharacterized membrane protein YvbJ